MQYPTHLIQKIPAKTKNSRPYGRYAVHIEEDGLDVRIGSTSSNLERALAKAKRRSEATIYATVQDYSRPIAQRMVALFRRGNPVYIEGEDLP